MNALQRARRDRGWSQTRTVAELQRQARRLGLRLPAAASLKTELSRWENGHRTPDEFNARLLGLVYGVEPGTLGLGHTDPTPPAAGGSWEDCVTGATEMWNRDLNRRDFLSAAAFTATAFAAPTLHAMLAPTTADPARLEGPATVTPAAVSFVRDMTRNLAGADNRFGGGQVRQAALRFLDGEVSPLLRTGRFDAGTGRELLRAAAELVRLVGWMSHDTGRDALAQRYLIQALQLAEAAADRALMAEILAAMSQQATYLSEPHEAVDLARAARSLAEREGLSALVAEASVMEAHAHARAGQGGRCAAALTAAEAALDRADRSSEPEWIGYFGEAYMSAKFGHCLRELGDHERAVHFADRSLQMSPGYARGRVFNLTLLAHSHAQHGDLDQACTVGTQAATEAAGMQSSRVRKHLTDLRRAVEPAVGSASVIALDQALAPVLSAA